MRMNGEIPYYKFGGKLFYKAVEVNRLIERNQVGWENLSQKLVTQMVTRETLKCLKVRKIGNLKWWPQGDSNPYGQNENLES